MPPDYREHEFIFGASILLQLDPILQSSEEVTKLYNAVHLRERTWYDSERQTHLREVSLWAVYPRIRRVSAALSQHSCIAPSRRTLLLLVSRTRGGGGRGTCEAGEGGILRRHA